MKIQSFTKKGADFSKRQFCQLLFSSSMTMAIAVILQISDVVIGGRLFGQNAVAAINLVTPLFTLVVFCGSLMPVGTGILYNYEMARINKEQAYKYFGQTAIITCVISISLFLLSVIGEDTYFTLIGTSELISGYGKEYYRWNRFVFLIFPIFNLLSEMVYSDGDELITNISNGVLFAGNIIVSVTAAKLTGLSGVGLGSFVSYTLASIVLLFHFFRKANSIRFRWHVCMRDFREIIKYSVIDACNYLYYSVSFFILNLFVVSRFDEKYLVIVTLLTSVIEVEVIFDGIGLAITPLICVYRGEKNGGSVKRILKYGFFAAVGEGLIVSVLFFVCADKIPALTGITSPELVRLSVLAIRVMSLSMVFTALVFLYSSYCNVLEKISLGNLLSFLSNSGVFIPLTVFFGMVLGLSGVWIGMSLTPVVSCGAFILFIRLKYGKGQFPYLMEEVESCEYTYDTYLSQENIMEICDWSSEVLGYHGADKKVINRVRLVIEEVYMQILEKNRNRVLTETCLYMDDRKIQLYLRHTGEIMDSTDGDAQVTSFRSFIIACMMQEQQNKDYSLMTGYNRAIFEFALTGEGQE